MYKRLITNALIRFSKFPVVGLFGPRQSGKTTEVKEVFKKHHYLNFEDPSIRSFAQENPQGFLREYENEHGIILDEFQHVPSILSYIQLDVDIKDRPGYFVLTGSQNFLMNQAISQSLAGRIGILTLLPLSIKELNEANLLSDNIHDLLISGSYPRIYAKNIEPRDFYPSYIQSYVERDVRQLVNIENLNTFQRFMQLCAARVSQQLNISDLATQCGISQKTVQSWLSILEASYIIFFLNPYYKNFSKRVVKTPKLYFYDTGLVCSLLNIRTTDEVALSSFRGPLFECLIIADFFKQFYNDGSKASLYYWRDANGRIEVDCLVDRESFLIPIEIKSSETIDDDYFKNLVKFQQIANQVLNSSYVVYGGSYRQTRKAGIIVGWQGMGNLISEIFALHLKQ